jgi:hypothetical protein
MHNKPDYSISCENLFRREKPPDFASLACRNSFFNGALFGFALGVFLATLVSWWVLG